MRVILLSIFAVSSIGTLGLIKYLINPQSYHNQNEEHSYSSLSNIRRGRSLSDKNFSLDTEGTSSQNQNRPITHTDKSNINERNGEASNLIDFAIIGFPKCGTSFLQKYLLNLDETYYGNDDGSVEENCELSRMEIEGFQHVNEMFEGHLGKKTQDGRRIKNAIKCPTQLQSRPAMAIYERFFPSTDYVITLRHPVLWFQSYYNFRVRHPIEPGLKMPAPAELIGSCGNGNKRNRSSNQNVCTEKAQFHHALSKLGKTPLISKDEWNLLRHDEIIYSFPHSKIFLMEIGQLTVADDWNGKERATKFVRDLQHFLKLDHELPPLSHQIDNRKLKRTEEIEKLEINICDNEHKLLRSTLIKIGNEAATWITKYFMKSPDVFVSSPDHFVRLLEKWKFDPCLEEEI